MGTSDSLVASFYNKYHYKLWRPETGIRTGASDGNGKTDGDAGFATFIATPCFPSYPSNHASGTGGGLEVMRRLFGAAGHDITITNNVPVLGILPAATITRHYSQLKAIADDVDGLRDAVCRPGWPSPVAAFGRGQRWQAATPTMVDVVPVTFTSGPLQKPSAS